MPIYVLYHANCYDGFTAAWAAWLHFGDRAVYLPVSYGSPMPDIEYGASVYLLDFTYPFDQMMDLQSRVSELVILDHHKTAQEALQRLDPMTSTDGAAWTTAIFDMNKSGAMLAWEYFHLDQTPPALIEYVQDRDLWTWELPHSREVSAALHAYEFDFQVWSELTVPSRIHELIQEGVAIERFKTKQVKMICDQAGYGYIGGHRVPVVNATAFWSEVGEELLTRYPEDAFVGSYYWTKDGNKVYSLRSRPGFDVSAVARTFGGGGHAQAAGFVVRSK